MTLAISFDEPTAHSYGDVHDERENHKVEQLSKGQEKAKLQTYNAQAVVHFLLYWFLVRRQPCVLNK